MSDRQATTHRAYVQRRELKILGKHDDNVGGGSDDDDDDDNAVMESDMGTNESDAINTTVGFSACGWAGGRGCKGLNIGRQ